MKNNRPKQQTGLEGISPDESGSGCLCLCFALTVSICPIRIAAVQRLIDLGSNVQENCKHQMLRQPLCRSNKEKYNVAKQIENSSGQI